MLRLGRTALARGLKWEAQYLPASIEQTDIFQRCYATEDTAPDRQDPNALASTSGQDEVDDGAPKERKRSRRWTRKDKGAWRDSTALNDEIFRNAPVWPDNVPISDPQSQMPWLFDTASPLMEHLKVLRRDHPLHFQAMLNQDPKSEEGPWPGASKILEWEVHVVFDSNPRTEEVHPKNKKVKCRVYLRDLQQEFDLSDRAIQYIALIAGPRYDPNKGLLTLTSEKFRHREDNRIHIVEMLTRLIDEGKRTFPVEDEPVQRRLRQ